MSKWAAFPLLSFDLESTGISVFNDRIVQGALVRVPGSEEKARRPETWQWLVNPGVPIPDAAAEVHGITTERVVDEGCHPAQALHELTDRIATWMSAGWPLVGMNLSYDLSMLEAENIRHGIATLASRLPKGIAPVLDVLVLDKHADPYRKGGRKLEALCATYGVTHIGAHDAAGDALAAARLFPKIMAKHARKFPGHSLGSLHQAQVTWRRDQMGSLAAYFDRNGTVHDGCCGAWPVHTADCAPAHREAVAA